MAYGGYGKMDPYEEYMSGNHSMPTPPGAAKGANILEYGKLGLDVAGTAIQGFGAYQAYRQAQAQAREEKRRYEQQQQIAEEQRKRAEEQQQLQNGLTFGGYARNLRESRDQPYAAYAARIGR